MLLLLPNSQLRSDFPRIKLVKIIIKAMLPKKLLGRGRVPQGVAMRKDQPHMPLTPSLTLMPMGSVVPCLMMWTMGGIILRAITPIMVLLCRMAILHNIATTGKLRTMPVEPLLTLTIAIHTTKIHHPKVLLPVLVAIHTTNLHHLTTLLPMLLHTITKISKLP